MRRLSVVAAGLALAAGTGVQALRASGDGCPARAELEAPATAWRQDPRYYTYVTLRNVNECYGFDNEPVDITLYGPHGRRAISYFQYADGSGPVHGDVGICCSVTLPPGGDWTIRLGHRVNDKGSDRIRICRVTIRMMRDVGLDVWRRMPAGGSVTGTGRFPPGWRDTAKPLPDDPTWREPCATGSG